MVDDYRSQRSPSPEGSGHAKGTWEEFHLVRARALTEEAGAKPWYGGPTGLPEDEREDLVQAVIEESELLGFWLAWWRAGGFTGLQAAGWNRATIFRKLRRFRSTFGSHPDDFRPDWIQLDLPQVWTAALRRRLTAGNEPELADETDAPIDVKVLGRDSSCHFVQAAARCEVAVSWRSR